VHNRLIVANSVRAVLGGKLIDDVTNAFVPLDCQTCGEELLSDDVTLAVDDLTIGALASLHHQDCRPSEWRHRMPAEAASLGLNLSWRANALVWHAADAPMVLVNPSCEAATLLEDPVPGQWRIATLNRYIAAGFVQGGRPFSPPRPLPGLDALLDPARGVTVTSSIEDLADVAWHTGMPDTVFGEAYSRDQLVVGVTTALDPFTESVTETRLNELIDRGEIMYASASMRSDAGEVEEVPDQRIMALLEMIRRRTGTVLDGDQLAYALTLYYRSRPPQGAPRLADRDRAMVALLVAVFSAGANGPVHVMTAADAISGELINACQGIVGGVFPVSRVGELSFTPEQRITIGTYTEFADGRARFDDGSSGYARIRPLALAVDPVPESERVTILRRCARLMEFEPFGTSAAKENNPIAEPAAPVLSAPHHDRSGRGTVSPADSAMPVSTVSPLFFPDGTLDSQAVGDGGRVGEVLDGAVRRFNGLLRGNDLLHVIAEDCSAGRRAAIRTALEVALVPGARLEDVRDVIEVYNPHGADGDSFDGAPASIAPELLDALTDFADAFTKDRAALGPVSVELLLACALDHPDAMDRDHLTILDFPAAAEALRRQVRLSTEPLPSLWDQASGRLRSEAFTANAWAVLEHAAQIAADLGHDMVLTPHCLLALLTETEGLADRVLRRQLPPQLGVTKAADSIASAFRLLDRGRDTVPQLHRDEIGASLCELLRTAQAESMARRGAEQVDVPYLLLAVLQSPSERLAAVLRAEPLLLDVGRLREHVLEAIRESRGAAPREVAYKLPSYLPPSEDLTWLARTGVISEACHLDGYFDTLCRALHRSTEHHVLITGLPGVGRTTLLRELARRAATGEIPFLRRKRFVRVDCRGVAPEQSEKQLTGLISTVGGRTDVVVCVDGLGPLLRGPDGVRHNLLLRSALIASKLHLIGVLTGHDYEDLIGTDHELLELTTRIEVAEPDRAAASDMARRAARELAGRFDVEVRDAAVRRAVVLAGDFVRRHRLPQSAVKVLQRACENLDYDRVRAGDGGGATAGIGADEVVRAVAELSGVPVGQLGGVKDALDYEGLLAERVLGQDEAVRALAQELRRISSGLAAVTPGPASVMLFAGLTGVGKTELAKAVADLYSASKRLQTYPMGNFTEPHSVSAFLGPPPGYVGHSSGGRLINELNADPYCVVLLDEAEKAHPEVLRPFLNLFDEGWIIDQRGVKAYGDRAIFILTTNAGHDVIARLARETSQEESATAVRAALRQIVTRYNEPVFPPELLARIRKVVVFRPLDLAAMEGICRKEIDRQHAFWRDKRDKELVVAEEIVQYVARTGDGLNVRAGGEEGGRIIAKLLGEMVEDPITLAVRDRSAEFQACDRIELCFDPAPPHVAVRLGTAARDGW
jgi:ATP-dependent Clp protease ATP-binding subunit ClpA